MLTPARSRTITVLLALLTLTAPRTPRVNASESETSRPWHFAYVPYTYPDDTFQPPIRTIRQVEGLIEKEGIRSVESFLARLHALDPGMFKGSILVFWTKALQEASYASPRVLLRSLDAKLIIAFNGDPKQLGYDAIEMMEYDEMEGRFLFADRVFTEGKKARSSGADCAACHAYPYTDPAMNRPLMDPYPVWPRMYGGSLASPKSEQELAKYTLFRKNAAEHPRYRYLHLKDISTSCDPSDSEKFPQAPRRILKGSGPVKSILGLHTHLSLWNLDRIVKALARHPRYDVLKPEIIALLRSEIKLRFGTADTAMKYSAKKTFNEAPFYDSDTITYDQNLPRNEHEFDGDGYDNIPCEVLDRPARTGTDDSEHSQRFTRLLAEEFGFALDYQGMALSRNDRGFKLGLRFIPDIFLKALENIPAAQPAAKDAAAITSPPPRLTAAKVLQANCASCHREGNSLAAPHMPFDDLGKFDSILDKKLAEKIQERLESADVEKRMPKDLPALSDEEKDLILKLLESRLKQK